MLSINSALELCELLLELGMYEDYDLITRGAIEICESLGLSWNVIVYNKYMKK